MCIMYDVLLQDMPCGYMALIEIPVCLYLASFLRLPDVDILMEAYLAKRLLISRASDNDVTFKKISKNFLRPINITASFCSFFRDC